MAVVTAVAATAAVAAVAAVTAAVNQAAQCKEEPMSLPGHRFFFFEAPDRGPILIRTAIGGIIATRAN
ncbi:hypothetical protein IAG25_04360 [Caballeronia sp. EK]|nr:hypothetical protein [Caballeronia sp. EK]